MLASTEKRYFEFLTFLSLLILDDIEHLHLVFKGNSIFSGPWEMVTGEWENSIITDGSFEKKMGSFFMGWSYGCSHGYG